MTESKKIKLLIGISDFRVGGAQKVVADIINYFDKEIFEIHLVTFFQSPNEEDFYNLLPEYITTHKLNARGFYDIKLWRETCLLLRKVRPDVVWSHLFFSNTILRSLKPLFSYQVVIVEHNTYPNQKTIQRLVDKFLSFFTYRIVGVSSGVIDFQVKEIGVAKERCVVISNGIAIKQLQAVTNEAKLLAYKEIGLTTSDKIIITVGQFIRQKNQIALVEAFALFRKSHPDYHLLIVGDGALRPVLEARVRECGLDNVVHLPGIKKQVASFLAIADFFVLPSLFEGFGIVCIEAMAMGLPVVSTKVTGPDSFVVEGENGFFSELDPQHLNEKMATVANLDEVTRENLKRNAKQTAERFSIEEVAKQYTALFVSAVRN